MLTKSQVVETIEATLEDGPKRAKEIVRACARKGIKPPRVFYWLKKLGETGEIQRVGEKYELIKFEETSKEEIDFLLEKIESRSPDVKRAAVRDFGDLCRKKRVSYHDSVWDFIEKALRGNKKDMKMHAIGFLERIAFNPLTLKEKKTMAKLRDFREDLKKVVVDEDIEPTCRSSAVLVLRSILAEEEFCDFSLKPREKDKPAFEKLIRETSGKGGSQPFMLVGRNMWDALLGAYSRQGKLAELRKWLYPLLEDKNKEVRGIAFGLLDELRGKERGLDLRVKL